jgi:hypothetical protein
MGYSMRRRPSKKAAKVERTPRMKLSAEESLWRMESFPERKAAFIAAIRKAMGPPPQSE